jgi:hypothetical protein
VGKTWKHAMVVEREAVQSAIHYVIDKQGEKMAVYEK